MTVTKEDIVRLRETSGAGMLDCKNALVEHKGNFDQALEALRKKGLAAAAKKSSRATKAGAVYSYIHMEGKIGVLIEVNCETDFVARTDDFKNFVKDAAMQIAAMSPAYVSREQVPQDILDREKRVLGSGLEGKPEAMKEKIIIGKLEKFYQQSCLVDQPFIKDDKKAIKDLLTTLIAKVGENCTIKRFTRYQLGEEV